MTTYVWCEDSGSGYQFWKAFFGELYPDFSVDTKKSNSGLRRAVGSINDDTDVYYIIMDNAVDNPDVLREVKRLKADVSDKDNIRLINIHSFEFSLLSFEHLENWVFAEDDELRKKRSDLLDARNKFVQLITSGGNAEELKSFKSLFDFGEKANSENISAKLLNQITRNTGFETDKSKIGICFVNSCCDWNERQEDDICGLDDTRLTLNDKMRQIREHSALQAAFKGAGL